MEKVKWSEQTIAIYEDIDLFSIITAAVKGKNYYMLMTFQKDTILAQAQAKFPFVQDIHFQLETGNTLGIDIAFTAPLFRVKLGEKMFGIRSDSLFFEIQSGMQLGTESFVVDTPQYLTGTTSLSGFFFEISVSDMVSLISLMQKEIPDMNRFVYLVGSKRFALFTQAGQTVYVNLSDKESIQDQLTKYHTLQQYYPSLDKLATIDLGSLNTMKVIVRKK
ncbi:MAG: hypothetical protein LBD75_05300 [Candidatus Peribacteria bacterium]|jgi:hypothetical protein|nr:hypothetical protein [Candidatus Peribacteria bacterium]